MEAAALDRFSTFASSRGPRLYRLAVLLTGDSHAAQDLVQDALASLYVAWRRVERAADPDAYARRVLVNASHRRFRRRRPPELLVDRLPDVAGPQPDDHADEELRRALLALPVGQREVVALRFLEDLSVEQTAEVLGCTPGTVKSQSSKALHALRTHLALAEEAS